MRNCGSISSTASVWPPSTPAGHANPQTTVIYTQLTEPALKPATEIINRLMADL
jgi:hypothetical protein